MDFTKVSDKTLQNRKVDLGFKILLQEGKLRKMRADLDEIQAEMIRRGLAVKSQPVDYKAKYEKCIEVLRRYDAGIIGMYDL